MFLEVLIVLHQHASTLIYLDRYTKVTLALIAVLLGVLATRFLAKPARVQAQTDAESLKSGWELCR